MDINRIIIYIIGFIFVFSSFLHSFDVFVIDPILSFCFSVSAFFFTYAEVTRFLLFPYKNTQRKKLKIVIDIIGISFYVIAFFSIIILPHTSLLQNFGVNKLQDLSNHLTLLGLGIIIVMLASTNAKDMLYKRLYEINSEQEEHIKYQERVVNDLINELDRLKSKEKQNI
ncbi:hypothetical protein [Ornithinibacillus sp. 179-J 7C1 HS]|uniref:hypothetical protein n=1 Tax=Ornithinibacillus sp. 179-J 7C1 HS TaxID=3142384 RepID=UPI00399FA8D9